jgi:hypothetical protein
MRSEYVRLFRVGYLLRSGMVRMHIISHIKVIMGFDLKVTNNGRGKAR